MRRDDAYLLDMVVAARKAMAIARSRDMAVATRNVRDFEDVDIKIIDPWTAA